MKIIYEGTISGYSFIMTDPSVIEIWSDINNDRPETYIFLKEGDVKDEKDFHQEIAYWAMRNGVV